MWWYLQLSDSTLSIFSLLPNNATEQILHSAEKEPEKINLYLLGWCC